MPEASESASSRIDSPQVEFNHLYTTLDRDTVDAIGNSEYVAKRFSVIRSTVDSGEGSWTGTYLRGRCAYVEVFAPGGAQGLIEGCSGAAFSTGRLGQIDDIEVHLKTAAPNRTKRALQVRRTEEGYVPWYHYLHLETTEPVPFSAWLMEVHKEYFSWRGIEAPSNDRFSRAAYLKASGVAETTWTDDILEVHVDLSSDEQEDLELLLRALGFSSTDVSNKIKYQSGSFSLIVSVVPDPRYRIRRIACTMAHSEPQPSALQFGPDAKLTAEGRVLVWEFGSVANAAS